MMLLLLYLVTFMLLDAYGDHYIIVTENRFIRYAVQNLITACGIITGLVVGYFSMGLDWPAIVAVAISIPALRWNIHDTALNALRDLPPHYLGTRARTDKFLRRLGGYPPAWRALALVLSFIASCVTYSHFIKP